MPIHDSPDLAISNRSLTWQAISDSDSAATKFCKQNVLATPYWGHLSLVEGLQIRVQGRPNTPAKWCTVRIHQMSNFRTNALDRSTLSQKNLKAQMKMVGYHSWASSHKTLAHHPFQNLTGKRTIHPTNQSDPLPPDLNTNMSRAVKARETFWSSSSFDWRRAFPHKVQEN